MVDASTPPEEPQEPQPQRVRWWFPAMFAISVAAAAIAIFAWVQRDDTSNPLDAPDLSSLGGNSPLVEDPAPGFSVPTFDGGSFTLAEHLTNDGRPVVLNLWASWCGPCRNEMPALSDAAERHPDVLFIGVAVRDSLTDAAGFADEVAVTYQLAYDEDDVVQDAYRPLGLPATFFIGTDGGIVSRYFGELFAETIDEQIDLAFGE